MKTEKLLEDLKKSMKEKNINRKNAVQMVRASILQIEKDKQIEVTDEQILEIITKEVKKRKDALADFQKANREDLINKITEELNCNENELVILEQFTEGKLFKSQKYNLSVITKAEIKKQLKNFFNELSKLMNVTIESEINITEDNIYNINLVTSNNSILIGKE